VKRIQFSFQPLAYEPLFFDALMRRAATAALRTVEHRQPESAHYSKSAECHPKSATGQALRYRAPNKSGDAQAMTLGTPAVSPCAQLKMRFIGNPGTQHANQKALRRTRNRRCTRLCRWRQAVAVRHQHVAVLKRGDKRLRWCLAGRLVGVGGVRAGSCLPLAESKGMASMFEPEGRVAQPPDLYEHRRAVPQSGTVNIEAQPGTTSAAPRAARTKRPNHSTSNQQKLSAPHPHPQPPPSFWAWPSRSPESNTRTKPTKPDKCHQPPA
jgi:hypothetical protein